MKITSKKTTSEVLAKFYELRQKRRSIEKEERELKDSILSLMADEKAMVAGHFLATITIRNRSSLDKDKLLAKLGDLSPYTTQSSYTVLEVKES